MGRGWFKKSGLWFTLINLMIVVSIIGLLSTLVLHFADAKTPSPNSETEGIGRYEVERIHGPLDLVGPVIQILVPKKGAKVTLSSQIIVQVQATDNRAVAKVLIEADLNGNGDRDENESIFADELSTGTIKTSLGPVTGPVGKRVLRVFASDASSNISEKTTEIMIINSKKNIQ